MGKKHARGSRSEKNITAKSKSGTEDGEELDDLQSIGMTAAIGGPKKDKKKGKGKAEKTPGNKQQGAKTNLTKERLEKLAEEHEEQDAESGGEESDSSLHESHDSRTKPKKKGVKKTIAKKKASEIDTQSKFTKITAPKGASSANAPLRIFACDACKRKSSQKCSKSGKDFAYMFRFVTPHQSAEPFYRCCPHGYKSHAPFLVCSSSNKQCASM